MENNFFPDNQSRNNLAHEYIWQLTHDGNYHHECVYLKYKYDQKKLAEEASTDQQRNGSSEINVTNDDSNSSDEDAYNDYIEKLALNGTDLFDKYELADIVIKKEFQQNNFKYENIIILQCFVILFLSYFFVYISFL